MAELLEPTYEESQTPLPPSLRNQRAGYRPPGAFLLSVFDLHDKIADFSRVGKIELDNAFPAFGRKRMGKFVRALRRFFALGTHNVIHTENFICRVVGIAGAVDHVYAQLRDTFEKSFRDCLRRGCAAWRGDCRLWRLDCQIFGGFFVLDGGGWYDKPSIGLFWYSIFA